MFSLIFSDIKLKSTLLILISISLCLSTARKIELFDSNFILRNELNNYKDLIKKAYIFENLIEKIDILKNHVNQKYSSNFYKGIDTHWITRLNEFNSRNISEAKWEQDETSYTNDSHIYLCIQSPITKKVHSLNTLIYILLHELAHFCIKDQIYDVNVNDRYLQDELQHGPDFWYLNNLLVKEAIECGIYTYVDYKKYNERYCGITLYTNVVS